LTLSIEGYLDRWRRLDNRYYYYLTDKGEEKAREIKAEVLNFIEEWGASCGGGFAC
jgi:DNA-binding MarR family transcriptional regulator